MPWVSASFMNHPILLAPAPSMFNACIYRSVDAPPRTLRQMLDRLERDRNRTYLGFKPVLLPLGFGWTLKCPPDIWSHLPAIYARDHGFGPAAQGTHGFGAPDTPHSDSVTTTPDKLAPGSSHRPDRTRAAAFRSQRRAH